MKIELNLLQQIFDSIQHISGRRIRSDKNGGFFHFNIPIFIGINLPCMNFQEAPFFQNVSIEDLLKSEMSFSKRQKSFQEPY